MTRVLFMPVKPRWAGRYLDGTKTAEVRRRMVHCRPGETVAIYATAPTKAVVALATVEGVIRLPSCPPATSYEWADAYWPARDRTAISADELRAYLEPESATGVGGHGAGCVVLLQDVRPIARPVGLHVVRDGIARFGVPQSIGWVRGAAAEGLLELCGAGAVR